MDDFIAVDWGTTNRRAYLLDAEGKCVEEFEDGQGILSVGPGGFPDAIAAIRERLGDRPLLMAGMVGSNRGWVEVPYAPCPAGAEDLARSIVRPGEREAIIPGVSYLDDSRADVMRGEEVQIFGALAAGAVDADAIVCHPGTHNKWVQLDGGRIAGFRTVMTGEIFNLLKDHSILADLLARPVAVDDAFKAGAARGLDGGDLLAELFAIRAHVVLLGTGREEAASYISGLLIGSDVRIGLASTNATEVAVMGRPELTTLYAAALAEAGVPTREIDGEPCFLAGIARIAELIDA